ncbi:MAG: choice-of-anchor D domain-containing protein, partial [Verrucomicrobiae bacterium]|nr:choice-of-anchor D domain-containing protein [Verrucomicrobiae bacterium]
LSFGTMVIGTSQNPPTYTLTVRNAGTSPLHISNIGIVGPGAAAFSLDAASLPNTLERSTHANILVTYLIPAVGNHNATLRIETDDPDDNPFEVALTGATINPEIEVESPPGSSLISGGVTFDYGTVEMGSTVQIRTVRISNLGVGDLSIGSISVTGIGATQFQVDRSTLPSALPSGQSGSFTLTFTPNILGDFSLPLSIGNNDLDEAPFRIALTGRVVSPEIEVLKPDLLPILDGGSFFLGNVSVGGESPTRTITIRNQGTSTLSLSGLSLAGNHPGDFTLDLSGVPSSLAPGAQTQFSIAFVPTAVGSRVGVLRILNNDLDESPFDISFTGIATNPEIAVNGPTGASLVSNSGNVSFERVGIGSTGATKTFTIRNLGQTDLNLSGITLSGDQPGEFVLSTSAIANRVAPGSSTRFSVAFSPESEGSKQALIEISNDDGDEAPFLIAITGEGVANSTPVVTLLGSDPLTFEAAPAYTDPGATATDTEDGPITPVMTPNTVSPRIPGNYTVTWTATDSLSGTGKATRSVAVVDTTPPTVTPPPNIVRPATNADGARVTFSGGSATDIVGVVSTSFSPPSGSQFPIGITQVTMSASDAAGNRATAEFSVTVLPGGLDKKGPVIRLTSPGSRAKNVSETFDIAGTAFDNFGLSAFLVRLNGQELPLDSASPTAANVAEPWSVTGVAAENGPNLIEVIATDLSGRVTRVTRTVYHSKIRPEFAGYYAAILEPADAPSLSNTGIVTLQVRDSGAFTGRIRIGSFSKPLQGVFSNEGFARFLPGANESLPLMTGNGTSLVDLGSLALQISEEIGITGTVSTEDPATHILAEFEGQKAPFHRNHPVPEELLNLPTSGDYSIAFPRLDQTPAIDPTSYPQGDGTGKVILSRTGSIRSTGYLADGTKFATSGKLRADLSLPFYLSLYSGKGNLHGTLTFEDLADSDISGPAFLWFRPEIPKSLRYPGGWPSS